MYSERRTLRQQLQQVRMRTKVRVVQLVFRPVQPADIQLRAGYVSVRVDTARHHNLALGIDDLSLRRKLGGLDNLAVKNSNVLHIALNALSRIVYEPVLDEQLVPWLQLFLWP